MSSLNKGPEKLVVSLQWDPSPAGRPHHDLDIVAATYTASAPQGPPVYLVHFGSRSPDGTITLNRDSKTGQGFGADEVMTLELYRMSTEYTRVVIGVAIQQGEGRLTFGEVADPAVRVKDGYVELCHEDFSGVPEATAATVGELSRDSSGEWRFRKVLRGFDADPTAFAQMMGNTGG
ncbi:TerD family protein [Streptomyces palmae]|uniref:TerD-family protein n=1 Tax=Streptomyces palmae TaxID=1701085 RepID=A0A4Z0HGW6_9ACTN|nr:TerD family protein [Streptomyces palmae]TGB17079.1 TerD-family protein [Streptomyces palmae]